MAGATKGEIIGIVTVQLGAKLQTVVGDDIDTLVSTDPKYPIEEIERVVLDAFASVASTVAHSPLQSDTWLFCVQEADLGSGDGQYHINKAIITGPIIQVDTSYDSSAFTYKFAELDSPTAIQDFRALRTAGRRLTELRSYAIAGETIYYPGTRIRVTFVPGDIGESGSDITEIPRKYADWVIAKSLATLFPRDGGKLGAAQFYGTQDMHYTQMILAGQSELPAFVPYQGA